MYFEEPVMNPFPNYNDFGKAKEFWLNLRFLIFPPKYHGKLIAWWHVIKLLM
jgi:hypothetical protein